MLPIFGKSAATAEPCEGAFDHPAAGQDLEAFCLVGALDDLERPVTMPTQRVPELVSGIAAIGKDVAQPREPVADRLEHVNGAIAVLDIGCVDENEDQEPAAAAIGGGLQGTLDATVTSSGSTANVPGYNGQQSLDQSQYFNNPNGLSAAGVTASQSSEQYAIVTATTTTTVSTPG